MNSFLRRKTYPPAIKGLIYLLLLILNPLPIIITSVGVSTSGSISVDRDKRIFETRSNTEESMNTNVILKENIDGLGIIGDVVNVKAGYARNYLVPRGLANLADARNVKELEHQKRQLARKLEKVTKDAEAVKARVKRLSASLHSVPVRKENCSVP